MSQPRRLNDLELSALADEELLGYIRRVRDAGDLEAVRLAVAVFCHRIHGDIRNRVRLRLEGRSDADIEMVTGAVIEGAMLAEFRGESVGELRALITRIIQRRVADYLRSRRGDVTEEPLASEHPGDDEIWGEVPQAPEEISGVWASDLLERSLAGISDAHREVIGHRLAGYTARETADRVNNHLGEELRTPMTPENVDQIHSRFRRRHRDLIVEAERRGDPDQTESERSDG